MELACIRWFGSTVVYLTFFTNIALLAAFLGISVGCLAASHRRNLIETVLPTLLVGMTLACVVLYVFTKFSDVMIDVGGQGSPQQVFFGTEYRARDLTRFVVPLEAVAGVEYNGGCYVLRLVGQRLQTTTQQYTTAIYLQLELNGVARLGTNPLDLLRRSVPGYQRTNDPTLAPRQRDDLFQEY